MLETDQAARFWGRGLQHASDLLIKRGTAMGPLIPLLFLVPLFLGASWLFRGVTIVAALFGVAAVGVVVEYCRQYAKFAATDPDRLQSEEYRHEMKRIHLIAAKELPYPVPAESLLLPEPMSNPAHPLPTVPELGSGAENADRQERQR